VTEAGFKATVRDFVNGDWMIWPAVARRWRKPSRRKLPKFLKERIDQQVPPIVHQLADIATSQNTRKQIGAAHQARGG